MEGLGAVPKGASLGTSVFELWTPQTWLVVPGPTVCPPEMEGMGLLPSRFRPPTDCSHMDLI